MYDIVFSRKMERDYARMERRGKDMSKLASVLDVLTCGAVVPPEYNDHKLRGDWDGFRELHIESDWLLIYQKNDTQLIIHAMGTGTHADLFKK